MEEYKEACSFASSKSAEEPEFVGTLKISSAAFPPRAEPINEI